MKKFIVKAILEWEVIAADATDARMKTTNYLNSSDHNAVGYDYEVEEKKTLEVYKWMKKFGVTHYSRVGDCNTLCGKPMLGNNYVGHRDEEGDCPRCMELLEEEGA